MLAGEPDHHTGGVSLSSEPCASTGARANRSRRTRRRGRSRRPDSGLTATEGAFFEAAKDVFAETDAVPDGLGPRFNLNSCLGCHRSRQAAARLPWSIRKSQWRPGGRQEHGAIFHHGGWPGARSALRAQSGRLARRRRARTVRDHRPLGRAGLQHRTTQLRCRACPQQRCVPDPNADVRPGPGGEHARCRSRSFVGGQCAAEACLGNIGTLQSNGNDGTIARFGWKAQNKSLLLFAGEAYNVEIGVTNDLFPSEREGNPACQFNHTHPESPTPLDLNEGRREPGRRLPVGYALFAAFMRLLAPPTPASATPAAAAAASPRHDPEQHGGRVCKQRLAGGGGHDLHRRSVVDILNVGNGRPRGDRCSRMSDVRPATPARRRAAGPSGCA